MYSVKMKEIPDLPTDRVSPLLFQTYETVDLRPSMAKARSSWVEHNDDYDVLFQDKDDRREVVEAVAFDIGGARFSKSLLKGYDKLNSGAFRADVWRLCALYRFGGVYVDIDTTCLVPLREYIFPADKFVAAAVPGVKWALANGLMASRPRHPFLLAAIQRAEEEMRWGETDGYLAVGPGNLGMAINYHLGLPRKNPFTAGVNNGFRLLQKDGHLFRYHKMAVADTKYDGYLEDLAADGIKHWQQTKTPTPLIQRIRRKLLS